MRERPQASSLAKRAIGKEGMLKLKEIVLLGKDAQKLVVQYQMVGHKNMHTNNIVQTE